MKNMQFVKLKWARADWSNLDTCGVFRGCRGHSQYRSAGCNQDSCRPVGKDRVALGAKHFHNMTALRQVHTINIYIENLNMHCALIMINRNCTFRSQKSKSLKKLRQANSQRCKTKHLANNQ